MADAPYALAATCRCLDEDLGFSTKECDRPLEELASHPVIADFLAKRRDSPIGQEVIQKLAPKLSVVWTDHACDE